MTDTIKIRCKVKQHSKKAWLIEAKHERGEIIQVWIPISQIYKTEVNTRLASDSYHRNPEKNFNRTIWIPEWLAKKKELYSPELAL